MTAPYFCRGGFAVKHNPGKFKAIGMEQTLEQTINRSSKSQGGIIGSTRKKASVAQWQLIHHKMLAVHNLQCSLSGVRQDGCELDVSHEFTKQETANAEEKMSKMITNILTRENPMHVDALTQSTLHNIMTQEIMSADIC